MNNNLSIINTISQEIDIFCQEIDLLCQVINIMPIRIRKFKTILS